LPIRKSYTVSAFYPHPPTNLLWSQHLQVLTETYPTTPRVFFWSYLLAFYNTHTHFTFLEVHAHLTLRQWQWCTYIIDFQFRLWYSVRVLQYGYIKDNIAGIRYIISGDSSSQWRRRNFDPAKNQLEKIA